MAKASKSITEYLVPATAGWSRWQTVDEAATQCVDETLDGEVTYSRGTQQRVLVLPVSHAWIVPAWLKGEKAYLKDMAMLHLERLGIRVEDPTHGLELHEAGEKDDARLCTVVALKHEPTPLAAGSDLPQTVTLSPFALPLEPSGITVWRELDRLVFAITLDDKLVYASPITAKRFDERALSELNNACLQLGFQGVLGRVQRMVLWLEEGEGDLGQIESLTGLQVTRAPHPGWGQRTVESGDLLPVDLQLAQQRQETRARQRLLGLSAGAVVSAVIAVMTVLITLANHEREMLREKVTEVSPRASRVLDQQAAWQEAAPAVDPAQGPMQLLLHLMEPEISKEVTLMEFDFTPDRVVLRGHTTTPSPALQYAQEVQQSESLFAYEWEAPPPSMEADESATFELTGDRL